MRYYPRAGMTIRNAQGGRAKAWVFLCAAAGCSDAASYGTTYPTYDASSDVATVGRSRAADSGVARQQPDATLPDHALTMDTREAAASDRLAPPDFTDAPTAPAPAVDPDADTSPRTSLFCPDTLRDPVTEECDDGPGDTEDSCTATCRITNLPVVPDSAPRADAGQPPSRHLGTAPHVASANDGGFAVVYRETGPATNTTIHLQPFTPWGARDGAPLTVSVDTEPLGSGNPAVAALSRTGRYAVAWTETTNGTPDIAMRIVAAGGTPSGAPRSPHESTAGPQEDPDLLWAGSELIAAWTDLVTVKYRRLTAGLTPLGPETELQTNTALQSNVTLAPLADSWAAAWRSNDGGLESIVVRAGDVLAATEPAPPGPEGDRPAIVELDAEHLLVLYTIGTDPLGGGPANVGRLRIGVVDLTAAADAGAPGSIVSQPPEIMTSPYDSDASLEQRRPSAVRVGDRVFIGWETESPLNDPLESEIWLQEIGWNADAPGVIEVLDEEPVQVDATRMGDQLDPGLAASPLFPEGALITVWEDYSQDLSGQGSADLVLGFRPTPFVTLARPDGGAP